MGDRQMNKLDWPHRTKYWGDENYEGIDLGIRFAVRALHARGYETCQSCEGGEGHAYDYPTVDLIAAEDAAGFAAVATLVEFGLPVRDLAQLWRIDALGRPSETIWRITFHRACPERADDWLMFVWGYQAQPDSRGDDLRLWWAGEADGGTPSRPCAARDGGAWYRDRRARCALRTGGGGMTTVDEVLATLPIRWRDQRLPLTRDRCEVCGLLLFESERVEITGTFKVADDDPMMGGLGFITATYCHEHAPKEHTP